MYINILPKDVSAMQEGVFFRQYTMMLPSGRFLESLCGCFESMITMKLFIGNHDSSFHQVLDNTFILDLYFMACGTILELCSWFYIKWPCDGIYILQGLVHVFLSRNLCSFHEKPQKIWILRIIHDWTKDIEISFHIQILISRFRIFFLVNK